jgi:hypothetical protein
MSNHTPWDKEAAARIQSAAAGNPSSSSAHDGLNRKAQPEADKNERDQDDEQDADR